MTSKEKYEIFCQEELLPVFVQPWYLDVVCDGVSWEVAIIEEDQKTIGALPYVMKNKGPFKLIGMPWLVKMMGPFLAEKLRHTDKSKRITKALIEQLPAVADFHQSFHYQVTDWLPFYWKQYQQSTAYSYVLEDISDLEKVYGNIKSTYRNNKIKKAKQLVEIRTDRSLEDFYNVQKMTFARQGKEFVIPLSFMKKFDKILTEKRSGQKFFAVDQSGKIHSVAYLIWDKHSAYYLLAGDDPNLRNSGSGILLIWEAIKYTKKQLNLNRFDFQGSMIPSIEKVRRSFGAKPLPYFQIWKTNSKVYGWLKRMKSK